MMFFPALSELGGWLRHGLTLRVPGVDVAVDRDEAVSRLRGGHVAAAGGLGFSSDQLVWAEQVHGVEVAWVDGVDGVDGVGGVDGVDGVGALMGGVDGLVSARVGCGLGIYVADCCAVYVVDPRCRAVALLHSGRRGSDGGIVRRGIDELVRRCGSRPADLVVQLSPCIRPPWYEVDFAAMIRRDARDCGVPAGQIHDDGTCTASDLGRFYSYRAERGRTGRMCAVLGMVAE